MYKRILVPVENSSYDEAILQHIRGLAKLCGAKVILIHVADGFAARNAKQLDLRESEEMRLDLGYLEKLTGPDGELLNVRSTEDVGPQKSAHATKEETKPAPTKKVVVAQDDKAIVSTFDKDDEGWLVAGDAQAGREKPTYHKVGGNPGGFLSANDDGVTP